MRLFFLIFTAAMWIAEFAVAETIDLKVSQFKHITFEDIPQTVYSDDQGTLSMEVKRSSSLLLIPFDKIKEVRRVSFDWSFNGEWKLSSAKEEKTKAGDDSKLRVGLFVAGDAPWVPFIAPAWIKAVQNVMKLETNKLIYLQPGSLHPPGQTWESPYSDSIHNIAIPSAPLANGWFAVDFSLAKPLKVVGLWLMADGDNTKSNFTTKLRKLQLN